MLIDLANRWQLRRGFLVYRLFFSSRTSSADLLQLLRVTGALDHTHGHKQTPLLLPWKGYRTVAKDSIW